MAVFTMTVERTITQFVEVSIQADDINQAIAQAKRESIAQANRMVRTPGPSRPGWEAEISVNVIGNVHDDEGGIWI